MSYGVAIGFLYGVSSLAVKRVAGLLDFDDPGGTVTAVLAPPCPCLLMFTGTTGLVFSQTALQRCRASLIVPVCTTVNFLYATAGRTVAFSEPLPAEPLRLGLGLWLGGGALAPVVDELGLTDVTLIKIDVDGGELGVLHGAEATVKRENPALFIELELRIQPLGPVLALLSSLGYTGWVLPARDWMPLSDFDLVAHQRRTAHVAEHGLLRRSLAPHRRYVNSVLFLPAGRSPGPPA